MSIILLDVSFLKKVQHLFYSKTAVEKQVSERIDKA